VAQLAAWSLPPAINHCQRKDSKRRLTCLGISALTFLVRADIQKTRLTMSSTAGLHFDLHNSSMLRALTAARRLHRHLTEASVCRQKRGTVFSGEQPELKWVSLVAWHSHGMSTVAGSPKSPPAAQIPAGGWSVIHQCSALQSREGLGSHASCWQQRPRSSAH
jgi:hypothetical protein